MAQQVKPLVAPEELFEKVLPQCVERYIGRNAPSISLIYDALLLLCSTVVRITALRPKMAAKSYAQGQSAAWCDACTPEYACPAGKWVPGSGARPTAGNAHSEGGGPALYECAVWPVMSHNGNLTNAMALKAELFHTDHRHINTESDSGGVAQMLARQGCEPHTRAGTHNHRMCLTPCGVHQRVRFLCRRGLDCRSRYRGFP